MNIAQEENPKTQVLRIDFAKITADTKEKRDSIKKASLKWKRLKNKLKGKAPSPRSPRKRTYFDSSLPAVKYILQKEQKNEEDELSLYEHFKSYKFFHEFIETANAEERIRLITYLSKKFEYERHEAGSVIIKQGELSNKRIYIVLSGRLQMRLQNKNIKKKEEETQKINDQLKVPAPKPKIIHKLTPRLSFSLSSRSSFSPDASIKELINQQTQEDQLKTPGKLPSSKSNHRHKNTESKRIINEDSVGVESFAFQSIRVSQMEEHETKMTNLYGKVLCEFKETDHFGEQALFSLSRRPGTITAITDVELASFDLPQFREVHKQVNESKNCITQLLASILPRLKNHNNKIVLESLIEIAEVVDFLHTRKLTIEGEHGEDFFLVIHGQCELMKTVVYDKSEKLKIINPLYGLKKTAKEEIVIANVEKGSLIGDEILFNDNGMYEYTVTIISETAQFVKFNKKLFLFKLKQPILQDLESYSSRKSSRNVASLSEKLEKKGAQTDTQKLKGVRPIVSLPESIYSYSPNTHQPIKTPVKIRQEVKADVLNILLPKSSYQGVRNRLNNYQEGDEKLAAITSRPQLHLNSKEVSALKSMIFKRKDSFTSISTPRIKSIADTPSITPAYSGACTPRRVISPTQKRRAISTLGKNLRRHLDLVKVRSNATEKSLSNEQTSPRNKSFRKLEGTKTELNFNPRVLDGKKEPHKNQKPQTNPQISDNTDLLEFLTARLLKSRITSRSIPNLKIQPTNIGIDDPPILEIQSLSSREGSRDWSTNRVTSKSRNRNIIKPVSLTENALQITNESQLQGKPKLKRAFSQALPKELFINKNQKDPGNATTPKMEFQAPSVKGCSIVLAQS